MNADISRHLFRCRREFPFGNSLKRSTDGAPIIRWAGPAIRISRHEFVRNIQRPSEGPEPSATMKIESFTFDFPVTKISNSAQARARARARARANSLPLVIPAHPFPTTVWDFDRMDMFGKPTIHTHLSKRTFKWLR